MRLMTWQALSISLYLASNNSRRFETLLARAMLSQQMLESHQKVGPGTVECSQVDIILVNFNTPCTLPRVLSV
jgi:hypothetical protein